MSKAPGKVTSRQKFTIERVHRSQIRMAVYNPRLIEEDAKERLANGIAKFGLVEPIVWNQRTGNLVGGHQRLRILDEQEGTQDYDLSVSVIDMDEANEKKLNVVLNNPSAQGTWDQAGLERVLMELGQESPEALKDVGFRAEELLEICESPDLRAFLENTLGEENPPKPKKEPQQETPAEEGPDSDDGPRETAPASKGPRVLPEFCMMVVFNTPQEATEFLKKYQLPTDSRYIDAERFIECVGIKVKEVGPEAGQEGDREPPQDEETQG